MAIDAYSLCPGGTGKKIKFCCGDFLPELQKIDRMIEGEQYLACLQHIDHLLAQEPGRDRPCLLATKCMLLRMTDQREAAQPPPRRFVVKHPENQIALAELAILAAETDARAAFELLQGRCAPPNGNSMARTYQAMGHAAGSLLHAGSRWPPRLCCNCNATLPTKTTARRNCSSLSQAADVPLLLLDSDQPLLPCRATRLEFPL